MDYLGEPISIPDVVIPEPLQIPTATLELPRADVPSYKPLVVPPSDLRPPPGVKPPKSKEKPAREAPKPALAPPVPQLPQLPQLPPEVRTFDVPGTDLELPVPSGEILVTAATTATVSVAATLTATAIFKHLVSIMKPIIKQLWSKIRKKKPEPETS